MNYYIYYHRSINHDNHDDIAVCEAHSIQEAVEQFSEFYLHVSEEDVRRIDLHREGYVPGIMIVSDY